MEVIILVFIAAYFFYSKTSFMGNERKLEAELKKIEVPLTSVIQKHKPVCGDFLGKKADDLFRDYLDDSQEIKKRLSALIKLLILLKFVMALESSFPKDDLKPHKNSENEAKKLLNEISSDYKEYLSERLDPLSTINDDPFRSYSLESKLISMKAEVCLNVIRFPPNIFHGVAAIIKENCSGLFPKDMTDNSNLNSIISMSLNDRQFYGESLEIHRAFYKVLDEVFMKDFISHLNERSGE